jgi:hypothetical protein
MNELPGCPEVREVLPELAVGAVAGDERAWALSHVAGCVACRRELAEFSRAADTVLLLAPSVEPPPGFESRVLAALSPAAAPAPLRRRRWRLPHLRPAVAFAVAVVLAAGAGAQVVRWRSADDRALAENYRRTLAVADGRYLRAMRMTTVDGQSAGTVFLYQGNPSWLLVTVFAAPADGAYDVLVVDRNGGAHPAGTCQVTGGSGTAGYRLTLPVSNVAKVQLRSTNAVLTTVS